MTESRVYFQNKENNSQYHIKPDYWGNREPGLSAMIRLGNEEEWIAPCIESIIDWFDEIVCCLQCSTDKTETILRGFNSSKIKIYHYPFMSVPNGPGHDKQQRGSVYERAYFYNWSLAKTTRRWVSKWDGDMVAHDALGDEIRKIIEDADKNEIDVITMAGVNITQGLTHKSKFRPSTANEPRFFRMIPDVYYFSSKHCEDIHHPSFCRGRGYGEGKEIECGDRVHRLKHKGYLHFKWAKSIRAAVLAWPADWQSIPHFQRVYESHAPGREYTGKIPKALTGVMYG